MIITLNEAAHVKRSVRAAALALKEAGVRGRVTVVDSGSIDGTVDALAAEPVDVLVLDAADEDRCPSLGRSVGARHSSAPWIWFLDGDMLASRAFLPAAFREIERGGVAVTGWMDDILRDGTRIKNSKAYRHGQRRTSRFGGAILIRRDVLEAVGGWDPRISSTEELDLYLRLASAGHEVMLVEELVAFHLGRERRSGSLVGRVLPYPCGDARNRGVAEAVAVWQSEKRLWDAVRHYPAPFVTAVLLPVGIYAMIRRVEVGIAVVIAASFVSRRIWKRVLHNGLLALQWITAMAVRPPLRDAGIPPFRVIQLGGTHRADR